MTTWNDVLDAVDAAAAAGAVYAYELAAGRLTIEWVDGTTDRFTSPEAAQRAVENRAEEWECMSDDERDDDRRAGETRRAQARAIEWLQANPRTDVVDCGGSVYIRTRRGYVVRVSNHAATQNNRFEHVADFRAPDHPALYDRRQFRRAVAEALRDHRDPSRVIRLRQGVVSH